jgi:hypothetical protein
VTGDVIAAGSRQRGNPILQPAIEEWMYRSGPPQPRAFRLLAQRIEEAKYLAKLGELAPASTRFLVCSEQIPSFVEERRGGTSRHDAS